jgi:DNA mismatch repair protein MLH3
MENELQNLVRSYLAEIEEVGPSFSLPSANPAGNEDVVWQKALRWCPKALINLINSRACRGEYVILRLSCAADQHAEQVLSCLTTR